MSQFRKLLTSVFAKLPSRVDPSKFELTDTGLVLCKMESEWFPEYAGRVFVAGDFLEVQASGGVASKLSAAGFNVVDELAR